MFLKTRATRRRYSSSRGKSVPRIPSPFKKHTRMPRRDRTDIYSLISNSRPQKIVVYVQTCFPTRAFKLSTFRAKRNEYKMVESHRSSSSLVDTSAMSTNRKQRFCAIDKKHAEILCALRHFNAKERVAFFRAADPKLVRCVCECIFNVLCGNVPIQSKQKTNFKKHASVLRKLVEKKSSGFRHERDFAL